MRTLSWRTGAGSALGLAVFLPLLAAAPVRAQQVHGTVLDGSTHAPIKDADVVLVGSKGKEASVVGRVLTDSTGQFALKIPAFGAYAVKVSAIGYAPYSSQAFTVDTSQEASIQVSLTPAPLAVKGVSVRVAAMRQELEKVGFYRRKKAGLSAATFLEPKQIREKTSSGKIIDAFYGIPGVHVEQVATSAGSLWDVTAPSANTDYFMNAATGKAATCLPSVYLDGNIIRPGGNTASAEADAGQWTTIVNPNDVAGIEVYTTPAGLPAFAGGSDSPCGAILIWTTSH